MTISYVGPARLWTATTGDPQAKDAWAAPTSSNMVLAQALATGNVSVNIGGLTTFTLSANNGAADQSRPHVQVYTGALPGTCTVTIPNIQRYGYAQNSTTGGFNVMLTSGGGTQATIPPDGSLYWYSCDGAGNVSLTPPQGWTKIGLFAPSGVSTLAFPMPVAFRRFRVTLENIAVTSAGAFMGMRFSSDGGATYNTTGYAYANIGADTTGSVGGSGSAAAASILLMNFMDGTPPNGSDCTVEVYPGSASSLPRVRGTAFGPTSLGTGLQSVIAGGLGVNAVMNYGQVFMSVGNFSGTVITEGLV